MKKKRVRIGVITSLCYEFSNFIAEGIEKELSYAVYDSNWNVDVINVFKPYQTSFNLEEELKAYAAVVVVGYQSIINGYDIADTCSYLGKTLITFSDDGEVKKYKELMPRLVEICERVINDAKTN